MAPRRGNGAEPIWPDGPGHWRVAPRLGKDADGNPIRVYKRVPGTIHDARAALHEIYAEHKAGTLKTGQQTFAAYLTEVWLPKQESKDRSPNSLRAYRNRIQCVQTDPVGQILLAKLTTLDLDNWMERLRRRKLAPVTLDGILTTINAALSAAANWKLIGDNPVKGMDDKPHPRERAKYRFKITELAEIVRTCADLDRHHLGAAFYLVLEGGIRPAEVCGLQIGDVDFERGGVAVERSIAYGLGGGQTVWATKTEGSETFVPLSSFAMDLLRSHLQRLRQVQPKAVIQLLTRNRRQEQWLFPSPVIPDQPVTMDKLRKDFHLLRKSLGLPYFRLYDLRQAGGNLHKAGGVQPLTIMELMRHSNFATTRKYYLTADEAAQQAAREQTFGQLWKDVGEAKG